MTDHIKTAIIISASSDIGAAMCCRWLKAGWKIFGTYRTYSEKVVELKEQGVNMYPCNLENNHSVKDYIDELIKSNVCWDTLVLSAGSIEPVGPFEERDFQSWEKSIRVNFTGQLHVVHELLPLRNRHNKLGACVLFFAGGSTNNAVVNYSAYTISKIALIKMCELLDAEIEDARFVIIGPGWVNTKIHKATIDAGEKFAGENYLKTKKILSEGNFTSIEKVLDSCDWVISQPKEIISGRNFSTVYDKWGTKDLVDALQANTNMYKLRRYGNN